MKNQLLCGQGQETLSCLNHLTLTKLADWRAVPVGENWEQYDKSNLTCIILRASLYEACAPVHQFRQRRLQKNKSTAHHQERVIANSPLGVPKSFFGHKSSKFS